MRVRIQSRAVRTRGGGRPRHQHRRAAGQGGLGESHRADLVRSARATSILTVRSRSNTASSGRKKASPSARSSSSTSRGESPGRRSTRSPSSRRTTRSSRRSKWTLELSEVLELQEDVMSKAEGRSLQPPTNLAAGAFARERGCEPANIADEAGSQHAGTGGQNPKPQPFGRGDERSRTDSAGPHPGG